MQIEIITDEHGARVVHKGTGAIVGFGRTPYQAAAHAIHMVELALVRHYGEPPVLVSDYQRIAN